jgi:prepilin-type N-terminal cleavage/methylation domain-containing protein
MARKERQNGSIRLVEGGFTLVELLVVIAIIAVLATLTTGVVMKAKNRADKTVCINNLKQIGTAAIMYSDDHRGRYMWTEPFSSGTPTPLTDDDDARKALALLYKWDYVDTTNIYICRSSPDDAAAEIEDLTERQDTFALEEFNCSFTYRNMLTTNNSKSTTPISGDKRSGDQEITNHTDGRHVLFKGGNVEFYKTAQLKDTNDNLMKKFRKELIGFGITP